MKSVFLLAAGSASRWNGKIKQLLDVEGESIIKRTVRIVHECDPCCELYIISFRPELRMDGCTYIDTKQSTSCLASTMLLTVPFWTDENVFLMSDVLFTKEVIQKILSGSGIQFYGSWENVKGIHPERVAAIFPLIEKERILSSLVRAVQEYTSYHSYAANEVPCMVMGPRAFLYYRLLQFTGIPGFFMHHCVYPLLHYSIWRTPGYGIQNIPGEIIDFDTPEDYELYYTRQNRSG